MSADPISLDELEQLLVVAQLALPLTIPVEMGAVWNIEDQDGPIALVSQLVDDSVHAKQPRRTAITKLFATAINALPKLLALARNVDETNAKAASLRSALCFVELEYMRLADGGPRLSSRRAEVSHATTAALACDAGRALAGEVELLRELEQAAVQANSGRVFHIEGTPQHRVSIALAKLKAYREQHKIGCELDTDGDGNCPIHPNGCPTNK